MVASCVGGKGHRCFLWRWPSSRNICRKRFASRVQAYGSCSGRILPQRIARSSKCVFPSLCQNSRLWATCLPPRFGAFTEILLRVTLLWPGNLQYDPEPNRRRCTTVSRHGAGFPVGLWGHVHLAIPDDNRCAMRRIAPLPATGESRSSAV
jgi:hypothetical protein